MKKIVVVTVASALIALTLAGCSAPAEESGGSEPEASAPSQSQAEEQAPEQEADQDSNKMTVTSFVAKYETEFTDSQVQAISLAAGNVGTQESLLASKYDDTTTQEDVDQAVVSFDSVIQGYAASFGEEVQTATQSDASSVSSLLYSRTVEIAEGQLDETMQALEDMQG